jgi:uncharacterized membrane protein
MNVETERGTSKNRIEALTDGVFATVMIVLVLNLTGPLMSTPSSSTELPNLLRNLLPFIFVYLHSFFFLSIVWVGHHTFFYFIKRVDRHLILLNLLFLLFVGFVPFVAALHGKYFDQLSFLIYGCDIVAVLLALVAIWRYSTTHHRLVDRNLDPEIIRLENKRLLICTPFIVVAFALSPVSIYLSHAALVSVGFYLLLYSPLDIHWLGA